MSQWLGLSSSVSSLISKTLSASFRAGIWTKGGYETIREDGGYNPYSTGGNLIQILYASDFSLNTAGQEEKDFSEIWCI